MTYKQKKLLSQMQEQDKSQHYSHMQHARIAEGKSPHKIHKVGALLSFESISDNTPFVAYPNMWPERLENTIGRKTKLGNASTTIHAELAALCGCTHATDGGTFYVTDLPCPNCAKIIAEAGIQNVYIDAHSHNTPLGKKMALYFETVSMPIFAAAQINVFELNIEQKTEKVWHVVQDKTRSKPKPENLWITETHNEERTISAMKAQAEQRQVNNMPYAACLARSKTNNSAAMKTIIALLHPSMGLTSKQCAEISEQQNKYSPNIRPVNRLIGACARNGLEIINGTLLSSQTPTAREFVNMIGADLTKLNIIDTAECRDKFGLVALEQIEKHKIIDITVA